VYFSLLVAVLVMPIMSVIAMIISKRHIIAVAVDVPENAFKNEQIRIAVSIKNCGLLPVIYNEVKINYIMFDRCVEAVSDSKVEVAINPGETKQIILKTAIPHYALTEIFVESIKIRDYLGLFRTTKRLEYRKYNNKYTKTLEKQHDFAKKKDVRKQKDVIKKNVSKKQKNLLLQQSLKKQIPVIPFFEPETEDFSENAVVKNLSAIQDFQTAAAFSAFSNSGEFEGIREYRPGDTRNRSHQKLSAKSDVTFVKEYNESKYPPILLILDLPESLGSVRTDEIIDDFTETAKGLMRKQIPFFVLNYGFDYEGRLVNNFEDFKQLLINIIKAISVTKYNEYISDGIPQQFNIVYSFPNDPNLQVTNM
jgi:hypothetical protein